jgi:hypothetical protein
MANAGSKLAQWALDLNLYIPSQDELEIIYRNLKPTTDTNSQWGRSGINVSAIEPTKPYTLAMPAQSLAESFKEGGSEAFDPVSYWSSTQHAADFGYALFQNFGNGNQSYGTKGYKMCSVAVSRLPI